MKSRPNFNYIGHNLKKMSEVPTIMNEVLGPGGVTKLVTHLGNTIQIEKSGKAYINRYINFLYLKLISYI